MSKTSDVGLAAILLLAMTSSPALAQYISPPELKLLDKNNVDLLSGSAQATLDLAMFRNPLSNLNYTMTYNSTRSQSNLNIYMIRYQDDNNIKIYATIFLEGREIKFIRGENGYSILRSSYEYLSESADGKTFTYIDRTGAQFIFGIPNLPEVGYCLQNSFVSPGQCGLLLISRTEPNGVKLSMSYLTMSGYFRLTNVSSNIGYNAALKYPNSNLPGSNNPYWHVAVQVDLANLAVPAKRPMSITFSQIGNKIKDSAGGLWDVVFSTDGVQSIQRPGSLQPDIKYSYSRDSTGLKTVFTQGSTQFSYYSNSGSLDVFPLPTTRKDAASNLYSVYYSKLKSKIYEDYFVSKIIDENGRTYLYDMDGSHQINKISYPEGNYVTYAYDAFSRITERRQYPKSGDPSGVLLSKATYSSDCGNMKICLKPLSVTDPLNSTTDYTYDPVHGGIITETSPPDNSGIRRVKRLNYAQRYAWIGNGNGGYVRAQSAVWVVAEERICQTSATVSNACAGGQNDEIVATYDYGPDDGRDGNNLLLRGKNVSVGGVAQRTCYSYDHMGNVISTTSPRAGLLLCP